MSTTQEKWASMTERERDAWVAEHVMGRVRALVAAEKIHEWYAEMLAMPIDDADAVSITAQIIRDAYAGRTESMSQALFDIARECGQPDVDSSSPAKWVRERLASKDAEIKELKMHIEELKATISKMSEAVMMPHINRQIGP